MKQKQIPTKKHFQNLKYLMSFIFAFVSFLSAFQSDKQNSQSFKDDQYYFGVEIPAQWSVKQSVDSSSFLRLRATSLDKLFTIFIYSFQVNGVIDVEKLAAKDRETFNNLGSLLSRKSIKLHWWNDISKIENIYDKSGQGYYVKGSYSTDGSYGYIILAYSKTNDFMLANITFESFRTNFPFLLNLKSMFYRFGSVMLYVIGIGLMGFCFLGFWFHDREWKWWLFTILPIAIGFVVYFIEGSTAIGYIGIPIAIFIALLFGSIGVFLFFE